jgi:hypothetical protein
MANISPSVRVYIDTKGLQVNLGPAYLTAYFQIDGRPEYCLLNKDNGRYFLDVNPADPQVPPALQSRVVCVTSFEKIERNFQHNPKCGNYPHHFGTGKKRQVVNIEVTSWKDSRAYGVQVLIKAPSIALWRDARTKLLSGKLEAKYSYESSVVRAQLIS